MKRIAIFASGNGSNAEGIVNYFKKRKTAEVAIILSNNPKAYVLERARDLGVRHITFNRADFYQSGVVLSVLKKEAIDFIVLAGFLWLVPEQLVNAYPNKILNIHPALLPKYGGKGMYGAKVHEAVKSRGEPESGITIHLVNKNYDEGDIVFQATCPVHADDTPEDIAQKVHELEYQHYPRVIDKVINK